MRGKRLTLLILILSLIIFRLVLLIPLVRSQSASKDITATVKASVCGNSVIEGGEDCEGENLNGQTCESLGYGSGTLTCDIACSFDTSGCSPAPTATPTPTGTPTPTPTSTPTPTLTPTPIEVTATSTPAPAATSTPGPAATSTPAPAATATPVSTPTIPPAVAVFDIDGSGRIEIAEVFTVVKSWVEEWKEVLIEEIKVSQGEVAPETLPTRKIKKCDVNRDRKCNLLDFSVLLYYIGR